MTAKVIFEQFRNLFPELASNSNTFTQRTLNSIIVRMNDGKKLIFTYLNKGEWELMTFFFEPSYLKEKGKDNGAK